MSNYRQLSFSGGEISPALWARVDLLKYQTGLKQCKNFIVMRHGGVSNRPGTGFVAEVKDSTKAIRLIPFIFNSLQTYVLEFGNLYMRVHKNGVQLTEAAKTITGATQANPCVITATSHGYTNGDEVNITGVVGMTGLNSRNFKVANKTTNTFELQYMDGTNVNSTSFGSYTSGGSSKKVYEISSPYAEADLSTFEYIQSADVITITHPTYEPRKLSRTGDINWTFSTFTWGSILNAPTSVNVSGTAGTKTFRYKVTALNSGTYEESLPSAAGTQTNLADPTSAAPITITWTAPAGTPAQYYVYKEIGDGSDSYGWIGVATSTSFKDTNYLPDMLDEPPVARTPFGADGSNNCPSTVTYYQQRLMFANTNNNTEGVWGTKTALPNNLMVSSPMQDDDAVTFSMVGRQVNAVKHLLDIGKLMVFTSGGEWIIDGDPSGILTPSDINPRQYTGQGSGNLPPLVVGGNALYVQARGSVIRDLFFEQESQGYRGNELTIFASHLFDGYTLSDWSYQQIPHSIVWCVRNDGKLLGLTYVREHAVFGWHQHEFDGTVENVCSIPQGTEDVLYLVIKRTINGKTVKYIEYMKTRQIINVIDSVFMDSSLSYDGRNTGSTTMTLTGSGWTYLDNLTLTASSSFFTSADVGNAIHIAGTDGTTIRCVIQSYTSTTVVTVRPHKTVPTAMRSVAFTTWSKAVDEVGGLWHLEGKQVSIFADGFVVANPNNSSYTVITVTNGIVTLPREYSVIHVGLPITADMETLNIDVPQGQILTDKKKLVTKLTLFVEASRGIWAGYDANHLTEFKLRADEDYDNPASLNTGIIDILIKPEWNSTGKFFVRQIDPIPVSVLASVPAGYI